MVKVHEDNVNNGAGEACVWFRVDPMPPHQTGSLSEMNRDLLSAGRDVEMFHVSCTQLRGGRWLGESLITDYQARQSQYRGNSPLITYVNFCARQCGINLGRAAMHDAQQLTMLDHTDARWHMSFRRDHWFDVEISDELTHHSIQSEAVIGEFAFQTAMPA